MKKRALALALVLAVFGVQLVCLVEANPYSFFWEQIDIPPGTVPPEITILSPENYAAYSNGSLDVMVHIVRPKTIAGFRFGQLWVDYILDGSKVDIVYQYSPSSEVDINTVLNETTGGNHELVVQARCALERNMTYFYINSNSTVYFTTIGTVPQPTLSPSPKPTHSPAPTPEPESFPASLVMASSVTVATVVIGLGLIVYLIKRK